MNKVSISLITIIQQSFKLFYIYIFLVGELFEVLPIEIDVHLLFLNIELNISMKKIHRGIEI